MNPLPKIVLNSERKKKNFIPPMVGQRIYKEGNKENQLFSLELLFESTVNLGFKAQTKILSDFSIVIRDCHLGFLLIFRFNYVQHFITCKENRLLVCHVNYYRQYHWFRCF